ncbi:helix-turn-helix transcriptional regulator [Vibrio vulnificus]|uniref:helix-turn-helix transcriptional regulator n=1 Tax=Vibrio vulnificus TaxID=672 RepID=UPI0005F1C084|nr:DNA-binding protein [Vibrio vulnificus]HDY7887121.1 DNA-binding protein [Vibrio vulnificus]
MENQQPLFLTKQELASRWNVSLSFVSKAISYNPSKLPPYLKIGSAVRFRLQDVTAFEHNQLTNI